MCNDNETKKPANTTRNTNAEAHRLAALALLAQLEGMAEIRDVYDSVRERHDENTEGLDEIEKMIEQEADRIADEARALGIFADEYDCDCGCSEPAASETYEDEERADRATTPEDEGEHDGDEFSQWPSYIASLLRRRPRSAPRSPGMASVVFGAIGVGCAVAALASQWLNERKG